MSVAVVRPRSLFFYADSPMKPKTWTLPKFTSTAWHYTDRFIPDNSIMDGAECLCGMLERLWFVVGTFDAENDGSGKIPPHYFDTRPQYLELLLEYGWVVEGENGDLYVNDWAEHKPKNLKDADAARARRAAKDSEPSANNRDKSPTVAKRSQQSDPSDSDSDSDSDCTKKENPTDSPPLADAKGSLIIRIVDLWNSNPKLKRVRKVTPERAKKIKDRMKAIPDFEELFAAAVAKLPHEKQDFEWQPTFDWMVRNNTNIYRVVEGEFDAPKQRTISEILSDVRARSDEE